jgi:hypothetical protein
VQWNDQVLNRLADHREVQTVFVSAYAGAQVGHLRRQGDVRDGAGRLSRGDPPAAAPRAARRHPRRPDRRGPPPALRQRGAEGHARAATACTQRRGRAVRRDPFAAAACGLSARVKIIDLTDRCCEDRRCFSAIGGALAHHDKTHMTTASSAR